jgi:hypothetical protein
MKLSGAESEVLTLENFPDHPQAATEADATDVEIESFYQGTSELVPAESGFYSMSPKSPLDKLLMLSIAPLRREWARPWFTVAGKIGEGGETDVFFDPDGMPPGPGWRNE